MSEIVALARAWVGTPFHHRASRCGVGADCLGLIRGLWRARYGAEPVALPHYAASWGESGGAERLWQALAQHLEPACASEDGQVLLFRMQARALAKHVGIQTQGGRGFIHACPRAGVVEAPLSDPWARRIVARFSFPPNPLSVE